LELLASGSARALGLVLVMDRVPELGPEMVQALALDLELGSEQAQGLEPGQDSEMVRELG
jgi:hypothetical protein